MSPQPPAENPALDPPVLGGRSHAYVSPVATVGLDASVYEIAQRLRETGLRALVVVDDDRPVGIVTDRDLLLRTIAADVDPGSTRARDVMSGPLASVGTQECLEDILAVMADRGIRHVAVVDRGRLQGIVSLGEVVAALAEDLEHLADALRMPLPRPHPSARATERRRALEMRLQELERQIDAFGGGARNQLLYQVEVLRQQLRLERAAE